MSTPEWIKYKPTKVPTAYRFIVPKGIPAPDPVRLPPKPISTAEALRVGYTTYKTPSIDVNTGGAVNGDGIPSKFTSPEFWTGREEPSVPSREQFVGEGGLFGEPTIAGAGADEGFFGEAKGLDWGLILLLLGVGLLFLLAFGL